MDNEHSIMSKVQRSAVKKRPADPKIKICFPRDNLEPAKSIIGKISPAIFLLHPPKTGGTTLHFFLKAVCTYKNWSYKRFRVKRDAYDPPSLPVRASGYANNTGQNWTGGWDTVHSLSDADIASLTSSDGPLFFSGHFPFGVHEKLFGNDNRQIIYIANVRDPILRQLSSINYEHQKVITDPGHETLFDTYKRRYLNPDNPQILDNPQTRLFAGIEAMHADYCDDVIYNKALENILKYFLYVAPSEKTDVMMELLTGMLELPPVAYHNANLTPTKALPAFDQKTTDFLKDYHSYDMKLYRHMQTLWQEKCYDNFPVRTFDDETRGLYIPADYDLTRKAQTGLSLKQIKQKQLRITSNAGLNNLHP